MTNEKKSEESLFKKGWIWSIVAFLIIVIVSTRDGGNKVVQQSSVQERIEEYPSFSEETMDRDCILSCVGGDEVVLWDKPTSAAEGARLHDRVPCGTFCWAFNQYYNKEYDITFYAINTLDKRVKNSWGWLTEDLITWLEE